MYNLDKEEYEERYGEHVGYCRTHKHRVVDDWCEDCAIEMEDNDVEDEDDSVPYEEWVSECCGAYPIGALQQTEEDMAFGVCGHCKEHTSFDIG